ncbi:MAG: hypothetical protein ABFD50_18935 [Smithella sp.]
MKNFKDWKTTVPGVMAGLVLIAKAIFPDYAIQCDAIAAAAVTVLGINATGSN